MNTKAPKAKLLMDFHYETFDQLVTSMGTVEAGVYGHPELFDNPVPDKATFEAQRIAFSTAVVAAKEGSHKVIAEKNKLRSSSLKMMSKLARYVMETANHDLPTLTASGFTVAVGNPSPKLLDQPTIKALTQTVSGEIAGNPNSVAGARIYEMRAGALGPGGTAPTNWTAIQTPNSKTATVFKGLTPGTVYAFQVRAFGLAGWTAFSDPVNKMST